MYDLSLLYHDSFTAERKSNWELPTYAYSGKYKLAEECRAPSSLVYIDGLAGQAAWCSPTAAIRSDYYLEIDLKGQFVVEYVTTQGLANGRVTSYK